MYLPLEKARNKVCVYGRFCHFTLFFFVIFRVMRGVWAHAHYASANEWHPRHLDDTCETSGGLT